MSCEQTTCVVRNLSGRNFDELFLISTGSRRWRLRNADKEVGFYRYDLVLIFLFYRADGFHVMGRRESRLFSVTLVSCGGLRHLYSIVILCSRTISGGHNIFYIIIMYNNVQYNNRPFIWRRLDDYIIYYCTNIIFIIHVPFH